MIGIKYTTRVDMPSGTAKKPTIKCPDTKAKENNFRTNLNKIHVYKFVHKR